jgi:hypothetical protein
MLKLFHETPSSNVSQMRADGFFKSNIYSARWYTFTESFEGALRYTGGDHDRVVLEFQLPPAAVKEFLWKYPGTTDFYGRAWALRKPLPIEYLKKVHPVPKDFEMPDHGEPLLSYDRR